jgi:pimeloyl-ACP methyl ester carboxylesterase
LLGELALDRYVLFGTSLGGLLAILLGAAEPGRAQGILVNDVGPELDEGGLARIRSYVGRASTWPTWMHAARELAEAHRGAFPDWKLEDWLIFAKRMGRLNNSGRIVLDYDLRIAEAFRMANPVDGFDMWGALNALKDVPMAVVRGETSDILSEATLARMRQEHPDLEAVTIPRIGHAPTLDEPEALAAISRLLAKVEERLELV